MHKLKVGDLVKVKGENVVFPINAIYYGDDSINNKGDFATGPDSALAYIKDLELYTGAISVFDKEGS